MSIDQEPHNPYAASDTILEKVKRNFFAVLDQKTTESQKQPPEVRVVRLWGEENKLFMYWKEGSDDNGWVIKSIATHLDPKCLFCLHPYRNKNQKRLSRGNVRRQPIKL